ncbi:hypothetical protein K437DRAFT_264476 [Tilletiaria anomala UBC 951]|uniref:Uncharacterized protein n=1 Tax=Tilletiaria anomala (strain ATCC 24038 / CBS 436.72 / UBC 951) TaxID=1037660 RepID=A0A066VMF1_TILAU|nr:uncharacterized protein K437DRAFT_264476 [Tilletiaria anomala UBC 951]KDN39760.1 hypothetical protein K437DRAFT_264476 [Tilletiaria anomala UBC 951]
MASSAASGDATNILPASAPPTLTQQDDALSRLPTDISSPHELTDWLDAVLDRLENKFQSANHQYDVRMQEMTERIDSLENSIQGSVSSKAGSENVHSPRQGNSE